MKLLYSRKDAAHLLSVSLRTIDSLIANKQLVTRRIGKAVRIPHADLIRFSQKDTFAIA